MALKQGERRFLVSFAEAALGLPDRDGAEAAVKRLEEFFAAAPPVIEKTMRTALFFMPPGLFGRWRFVKQDLPTRRALIERWFSDNTGRPPGLMLDPAAFLATIKSMLGAAYCELPRFWKEIGYKPLPDEFPMRGDKRVEPPSGPDVLPGRTATGQFLHDRVVPLDQAETECDIAIIGSGAGGIAALHALAERPGAKDLRILVLEAGELRTNESFPTRSFDGMTQLYFNAGVTPATSVRLGFIQGECVGGSTTINNAGCVEPKGVWGDLMRARWRRAGADFDWGALETAFDDLRDPLHISTVEQHTITKASHKAFEGFAPDGEILEANLKDCVACGQCNQGCRYDAHTAPFLTMLPTALEALPRAALVPRARVVRLGFTKGRVEQIEIEGGKRIRAKRVILTAGVYQTVRLLLDSNFYSADNRGDRTVGMNFTCNYASPVMGVFDEDLRGGDGIQIGYILHVPEQRLIIESAFAPPTVMGMMMPQRGEEWLRRARDINRYAVSFPTVSSDAVGSIDPTPLSPAGRYAIRMSLDDSDYTRLVHGMKLCADALFRAGAKEVFDSRYDGSSMKSAGEVKSHYAGAGRASFFRVQSAHLQGGCSIHPDPRFGVVDPSLKVHGVKNLWIMDASVFPAPITLNIQYTVMAAARVAAQSMPL